MVLVLTAPGVQFSIFAVKALTQFQAVVAVGTGPLGGSMLWLIVIAHVVVMDLAAAMADTVPMAVVLTVGALTVAALRDADVSTLQDKDSNEYS